MWLFTRTNTKGTAKGKEPYAPYIDEEDEFNGKNTRSTANFEKLKKSALSKSSKQKRTTIEPIQFEVGNNNNSIIGQDGRISVQNSQEISPNGKLVDQSDLEIQEVQDVSDVNIDQQLA